MKKQRWIGALAALMLAALPAVCASASEARVYDGADLLSASEERALEEEIALFQQETGMDFVFLTTDEPLEDGSQRSEADRFYISGGFGLDDEDSGVLYYIDMYNSYQYLYTRGAMIDYMTQARIDDVIDECRGLLGREAYLDAVETALDRVRGYISSGVPEGQYRYDAITGQRLTSRHKALTLTELLLCAVLAAGVGVAFAAVVTRRYRLKGSTYSYDFRGNCDLEITQRVDDYLRTTVTRARKPDPPRSSGGGHGGNGSGVHSSVGGGHHGGGGGRF